MSKKKMSEKKTTITKGDIIQIMEEYAIPAIKAEVRERADFLRTQAQGFRSQFDGRLHDLDDHVDACEAFMRSFADSIRSEVKLQIAASDDYGDRLQSQINALDNNIKKLDHLDSIRWDAHEKLHKAEGEPKVKLVYPYGMAPDMPKASPFPSVDYHRAKVLVKGMGSRDRAQLLAFLCELKEKDNAGK